MTSIRMSSNQDLMSRWLKMFHHEASQIKLIRLTAERLSRRFLPVWFYSWKALLKLFLFLFYFQRFCSKNLSIIFLPLTKRSSNNQIQLETSLSAFPTTVPFLSFSVYVGKFNLDLIFISFILLRGVVSSLSRKHFVMNNLSTWLAKRKMKTSAF